MQINDKAKRWIKKAILFLFAAFALLVAASWTERLRNANEEYAVYSAYLSEGLLNDAHDWSVGEPVQVVVEDTTKVGGNLRFRALYALDGRVHFDQMQTSTRASYLVRNLFQTRIVPKFVLPSRATVIFISESDIKSTPYGSPEFQKKYPRNLGFITLSGVGFNSTRTQPCSTSTTFVGCAAEDGTSSWKRSMAHGVRGTSIPRGFRKPLCSA
jgi:hypothetical protein